MSYKKLILFFILGSIVLLFTSCAPRQVKLTRSQLLMGHVPVNITIKFQAKQNQQALEATEKAYGRAREIEAKISEYQNTSDVSCLNQKAGKAYCSLSLETTWILQNSLEVSRLTRGAFDIRFASLSDEGRKSPVLLLTNEGKLTNKNTRIGLASMGKGFILDQMLEILRTEGFPQSLIDAGGDIRAGEGQWKVAIQIPRQPYGKNTKSFFISNQALTSSGNEENARNILDPRTLSPVKREESVSVIAPTATLANALSTAFYVLGPEESEKILPQFQEVKIIWVDKMGNSTSYLGSRP